MSTAPLSFVGKPVPITDDPPVNPQAQALQGAVSYASQQNPDQYAKLLKFQKLFGVPPVVSKGNESVVQQAADAQKLDPHTMSQVAPRTTAWASNPDNAAVSGVDEIHRMAGIEQNAAGMRNPMDDPDRRAAAMLGINPDDTFLDSVKDILTHPLESLVGADTPKAAALKAAAMKYLADRGGDPFSKSVVAANEAMEKPLWNPAGGKWFQRAFDPGSTNVYSRAITGIAKGVGGMTSPSTLGLLATLPLAPEDAAPLVSGTFATQMGEGTVQGGVQAVQSFAQGDYGGAAEAATGAGINALFAFGSAKHGLLGKSEAHLAAGEPTPAPANVPPEFAKEIQGSTFLSHAAQAVDAASQSKLKERSPEKFQEATEKLFEGDPSFRIPADKFAEHFGAEGPQAMAASLGSPNYAEAMLSGGDVEVPKANFLSRLDRERQKAMLPDLVDPATGLTARQHQESVTRLQEWASGGGVEKMAADTAAADAETAATPEYQQVRDTLRQRYAEAGESPEKAADLAEKDANVYSNLARQAGMTPSELLAMYNPKVVSGAAPGQVLYQSEKPRETTLHTPSGKLPAKYEIREAAGLIPSHDPMTFAKDPRYPAGVQERTYDTSKEAQARVIDQAQNYDPAYTINTNPDAVNGPPVVTKDGIVLGGNSRVMSTTRLYRSGGGDAYRNALKRDASTYGIAPEAIDDMKEPVLVRTVETDGKADTLRRLGTDLNRSMTGALGASEKAVSAGKNIKPETLRTVAGMMGDGSLRELLTAHGPKLARMMVDDGVITDRERPQYVDPKTGGLNDAGKDFVEKALLGSVIDDPRLMESAPKSVLNKLERSLGAITSFSSRADEWNLLPAIREAVGDLGSIQREGSTVELRTAQTGMFGERNPLVDAVMRSLDGKPNAVREAFDNFSRDADANLPGQSRMFGEAKAHDAFNHAFESNLTEEEYHDGLTRSASAEPARSGDATISNDVPEPPTGSAEPGGAEPARKARGWFRVLPDGSYEIGKSQFGDMSTFIHEPAHAYLKIIEDLAGREGASNTLKSDYGKIREFLGAEPGAKLTVEQQEKWARANEQYLREGKAPSVGLRGAFQRFGVWMQNVYHKASDLGVELTDDIRGVFDRLHAAESGVDRAVGEAGPRTFTSAEEAGWTPEQFEKYAESNHVSVEQAKSHILGMLNEAAVRDKTEAWLEEERNVRSAVSADIDAKPEYAAIRALRKGKMEDGTAIGIDKADLVKRFGESRVAELQQRHPGMYRMEGGIEADTAAEMLGYSSADEMLRAMESAPRRKDAIGQATRDYMTAKHGDIRYDGTFQDQARLALENNRRADGLHRELRALQGKLDAGKKADASRKEAARSIEVAPLEAYRQAAHEAIEAKAPADLQPTRYLDASRKYAREAFDAMRKDDATEAAQAKHKELLNHFLYREAMKAKEYVGKFASYAKRMQTKGVQAKLGLAGKDYRDQFNGILARYQLGPYQGQPPRTLTEWAQAQYDAGKFPAIDPAILNEARTVDYRNAPLSEIRLVHEALVNVRKLAMHELGMEVNGRKIEFGVATDALSERARASVKATPRPVFEENRTTGEAATDLVNRGAALLKRTEFLVNDLDGGAQGPWHDYLFNLAADAQGKESALHHEVTGRLGDAMRDMPKEQRARLLDKATIEGVAEPLTRRRMISMAFNMGNEGNLDRLSQTFASKGWDVAAIDRVKGSLTREEWQFVQNGWDALKPLGAAQADLERRQTGLPPVMVKPEPFTVELADGTKMDLAGGYYPVAMDPKYSSAGAQMDAGKTAQNMMESGYGRAVTSRGNMKERTGYGGPLLLDHEQVLTQHTAKVIKDITHREFMLVANKLLMDDGIRQTLRETVGGAHEAQLMPWLRTLVNNRNGSTIQGLGDVSAGLSTLRTNVVKAALGFKLGTVLLQLTHASSVFLHTSSGSYAQAMVDFVAHPKDMTDQIRGLSPNEMRFRGENIDRDMRVVLREEKKGLGDMWARAGMAPVQFMDHVLSFPLWLAVYRDALAEHADLPESEAKSRAMYKADGAVRTGLGANAPKDLPPVMRNNDVTKLLTTLGGFHNLKYNQIAGVVNKYRGGGTAGNLAYGAIMAAIIPAVMGPLITGRGPKDDENPGVWAAKRALLFPAETMALLNIGVEAIENKGDVRLSPIVSTAERGFKAAVHAGADKEDKDWTGIGMDALQSTMEAFGVSGADQLFKTGRYARRASEGEIADPNAWDAVAGAPHK